MQLNDCWWRRNDTDHMIDFDSFDLSICFGTGYTRAIVVAVHQIGSEIVVLESGCGIDHLFLGIESANV